MEQLKLEEVLADPVTQEPDESKTVRQRHKDKEAQAVEEGKKPQKPEPTQEREEKKPAAPQSTDKERAYYASAMDERRKRQALEAELAQLKASAAAPAAAPAEKKTFWDDTEAALEELKKNTPREANVSRLSTSELIARSKYQDFDEKVVIFQELMAQNPGLYPQFAQAPDPGEFVYKTAKFHKDLQQAGNMGNLRAQIESEVRVKVETELKEKEAKLKRERDALPGTLSDARGTKQQAVAWGGPPSLEDVLKP
mgnify:CR=1 FL=1